MTTSETLESCKRWLLSFGIPSASPSHFFFRFIHRGLAAHAVTLMLIGTVFMGWRGVASPQVYVGNLFFMAGLYMFTSCQWCLVSLLSFDETLFLILTAMKRLRERPSPRLSLDASRDSTSRSERLSFRSSMSRRPTRVLREPLPLSLHNTSKSSLF